MKHILLFILTTTFTVGLCQTPQIDSVAGLYLDSEKPGSSVLIARKGEITYHFAKGISNLELTVPLDTSSTFNIKSLTKQFTATGILMLYTDRKLKLNDPINKYFDGFESTITIHHLLSNSSGLIEMFKIPVVVSDYIKLGCHPNTIISLVQQSPREFEPSEQFSYCSSNYILLGRIIEIASDMSYNKFLTEQVDIK